MLVQLSKIKLSLTGWRQKQFQISLHKLLQEISSRNGVYWKKNATKKGIVPYLKFLSNLIVLFTVTRSGKGAKRPSPRHNPVGLTEQQNHWN